MITSKELYKKFLLKINKNDTNSNVKVPKSQFVLIYNEQIRVWLNNIIDLNESSDYIDDIQELLILDEELEFIKAGKINDTYKLPDNFYRRATGYCFASKGNCTDNSCVVWFIKPKNLDIYLKNTNLSPSFEYQETIALINNDKVSIYKTDFNINEFYVNYYQEPIEIDIEGYTKIDGSASVNINTNLSKVNAEEVLNLAALEALRNYENSESAQLAASRINKK